SPARTIGSAITFDGAECFLQTAANAFSAIKTDNLSASRNQVHQPFESRLHRVQILVDIGVVEFHRGENHGIRKVVQKLRALIEECCVVLVAIQNEVLAFPQAKAAAEILRNTSDQERRPKARRL